ncbi:MAG: sigma factor [Nocardioidaceae bacterium]
MTDLATAHDELRPLMFSIAYRMLGSVAEAQDVVKDAFLNMRRSTLDGMVIESVDAFAATVTTVEPVLTNGQPGARFLIGDGSLLGVMSLEIADGRIRSIANQINPDKLQHLGRVGDLTTLMQQAGPRQGGAGR